MYRKLKEFLKKKLKSYEDNLNAYLKQKRLDKEELKKIRKEIELIERKKYEKEKIKARYKNDLIKVRANLRKEPLWKQVGSYTLDVVKEVFKDPDKNKRNN